MKGPGPMLDQVEREVPVLWGTHLGHPIRNTEDTFWQKVEPTGFCWLWTGKLGPEGYALYWLKDRTVAVHRLAYELLIGSIPKGLVLDHLCRIRNCVNPDHLEPVTDTENSIRGNRFKVERDACLHGHAWTIENTLACGDSKRCRQCILIRTHAKRGKQCSFVAYCYMPSHSALVAA
ncbi:HNH endonuclease signature motif containing protein [Subtercola sp. RTI3]|uniref:HNH endonuclease signature motif containing protein n=1 Tax=Subtercola sp. RTI3 TaxID=3048639 RepID=UPI003A598AF6